MDLKLTAITAAFVMNGLHRADLDYIMQAYTGDGGQLELVEGVLEWVPAILALRAAADSIGVDYPGVFEYEVSCEFGQWLGGSIIDDGDLPDRGHAMEILIDLVESFFRVKDDPVTARRLRAVIDAAADKLMAPQAANDGA
jgi:hypothetical protein